MTWFWPPSWFSRKRVVAVTAPKCGHAELATEFFWMHIGSQLQVLHYLGVPYAEQSVILASAKPFKDVVDLMEVHGDHKNEDVADWCSGEEEMTADLYVARLKAVYDDNRRWHVIAVLQNIFRDKKEATFYADKLKDWKG
jgi:hypothetical protein